MKKNCIILIALILSYLLLGHAIVILFKDFVRYRVEIVKPKNAIDVHQAQKKVESYRKLLHSLSLSKQPIGKFKLRFYQLRDGNSEKYFTVMLLAKNDEIDDEYVCSFLTIKNCKKVQCDDSSGRKVAGGFFWLNDTITTRCLKYEII